MGQKVNPNLMRLGITKLWTSNWFANKSKYSQYLEEDYKIRKYIFKNLYQFIVSKIVIERFSKKLRIILYTARPGIVFSSRYEELLKLRRSLAKIVTPDLHIQFTVNEIYSADIDAKLLADSISEQLKNRVLFRNIIKRTLQTAMQRGAQGIKVELSGRLNGADIALSEWHREGRVPLHTFKADIDYYYLPCLTPYGVIGVKVWIFKGEISDNMSDVESHNKKEILKYE